MACLEINVHVSLVRSTTYTYRPIAMSQQDKHKRSNTIRALSILHGPLSFGGGGWWFVRQKCAAFCKKELGRNPELAPEEPLSSDDGCGAADADGGSCSQLSSALSSCKPSPASAPSALCCFFCCCLLLFFSLFFFTFKNPTMQERNRPAEVSFRSA